MPRPAEKLTYTVPELARAYGLGEDLARALVARGDIPSIRIGRRVLIAKVTAHAWLAEHGGDRLAGVKTEAS